ncbi:hypothetical protein KKH05_02280 [Patescibacteria group bacterium]|nr:hypothetical protein [Patescibacteria group bacterium]
MIHVENLALVISQQEAVVRGIEQDWQRGRLLFEDIKFWIHRGLDTSGLEILIGKCDERAVMRALCKRIGPH